MFSEGKDECDSFIEEAQKIVQLFEDGVDVKYMTEDLSRQASLIDPSTCPAGFDPVQVCDLLEICATPRTSTSPIICPESLRQRHHLRVSESSSLPPDSPTPNKSSGSLRVIIFIILILLLCIIYYLQLPTPCRRPVW